MTSSWFLIQGVLHAIFWLPILKDSERATPITCSAVALSGVLRTALVPYGNMETSTPHSSETSQVITMKQCTFDNVRETNTCAMFGWNPPARGRSTNTWNIHFLWLLLALRPFLSCTTAKSKRIEIISRTIAQKTQFGIRNLSPSKCFALFCHLGVILSQNPQIFAPSREIPPKYKKSNNV